MAINYPSATTVQFLTKLMSSGRIGIADIGKTMSQVDDVIRSLTGEMAATPAKPPEKAKTVNPNAKRRGRRTNAEIAAQAALAAAAAAAAEIRDEAPAPAAPVQTKLTMVEPVESVAVTAAPLAAAAPEIAPPKQQAREPVPVETEARDVPIQIIPARRGRGRPRRVDAAGVPLTPAKPVRRAIVEIEPEDIPEPIAVEAPEPPVSKLLRRNDVASHEHHHDELTVSANWLATETEKHSGIVKWFDQRSGKGVLRVSGMSEDIAIDAEMMADSGLKRLYKDQEIEATISRDSGKPRVIKLGLPGKETPSLKVLGDSVAMVRRQSRPVVVEIRRDTGKQRKDRAQAERIFGDKPNHLGK